jgi:transcriptional regulator with XRE-family HTH domain
VPEKLSDAIAAEVRRLCAEQGMSGRKLAQSTGMTLSVVQYKLAGERPWDVDDLDVVARVLGVRVTDLIERAQATD